MAAPVASLPGPVAALFADVDGTLTTDGQLEPASYSALCDLAARELPIVVVTGRPAGWGEAMARLWPVAAVVAENGAITFVPGEAGLRRRYGIPEEDISGLRERMHEALALVARAVPGARLSGDSAYREIDLAVDWNEEASLPLAAAEQITAILRGEGFAATRSSVHVNFGPLGVDKLTACRTVITEVLGGSPDCTDDYVYVGDALNDAPLFGGFSRSVGVANVRDVWDELEHHPAYITEGREGAGFRELAAHVGTRLRA